MPVLKQEHFGRWSERRRRRQPKEKQKDEEGEGVKEVEGQIDTCTREWRPDWMWRGQKHRRERGTV